MVDTILETEHIKMYGGHLSAIGYLLVAVVRARTLGNGKLSFPESFSDCDDLRCLVTK